MGQSLVQKETTGTSLKMRVFMLAGHSMLAGGWFALMIEGLRLRRNWSTLLLALVLGISFTFLAVVQARRILRRTGKEDAKP
jgi:hypothetical protein